MGDYAGAVELMKQCYGLNPDSPDHAYKLELYQGWRAKQEGKMALARRFFEQAHALAPRGQTAAREELQAMGVKVKDTGSDKKGGLGTLFGFGKKKK